MEKVIRFFRKTVYGVELDYPVDCKEAIFTLTGQKTLTYSTKKGLTQLGFSFVEVLESSINKEVPFERIFSGR